MCCCKGGMLFDWGLVGIRRDKTAAWQLLSRTRTHTPTLTHSRRHTYRERHIIQQSGVNSKLPSDKETLTVTCAPLPVTMSICVCGAHTDPGRPQLASLIHWNFVSYSLTVCMCTVCESHILQDGPNTSGSWSVYRVSRTQRNNLDAQIYFKIKMLNQMMKFIFFVIKRRCWFYILKIFFNY